MVIGTVLAIASLVVGAAGAVMGQRKSREAERARSRMEARQQQRERIQQLRQQQAAQAELRARSVASGTADSSGAEGGIAGIGASTAGNIAFQNIQSSAATGIRNTLSSANRRVSNANTLSNILKIGSLTANTGIFDQTDAEKSQDLGASKAGYSPEYMKGWGR